MDRVKGIEAGNGKGRHGPGDHHQPQGDGRRPTRHPARNCCWCRNQALPEWPWCQRPSISLLAREELLRPASRHFRPIYPRTRCSSHECAFGKALPFSELDRFLAQPKRMFQSTPVVKLGDHFKKVQQFQKRFKSMPSMLELDHLTVSGDVTFGRGVTLRGTVIIVANEGQKIQLPDGTVLENKLVSGNLAIIVRFAKWLPPKLADPPLVGTLSGSKSLKATACLVLYPMQSGIRKVRAVQAITRRPAGCNHSLFARACWAVVVVQPAF
jgi:hypothetical protein